VAQGVRRGIPGLSSLSVSQSRGYPLCRTPPPYPSFMPHPSKRPSQRSNSWILWTPASRVAGTAVQQGPRMPLRPSGAAPSHHLESLHGFLWPVPCVCGPGMEVLCDKLRIPAAGLGGMGNGILEYLTIELRPLPQSLLQSIPPSWLESLRQIPYYIYQTSLISSQERALVILTSSSTSSHQESK
jgi:hypothetical protein